jgi:hypothetical protein
MSRNKINTNWGADPDSPKPELWSGDGTVKLTFCLNSLIFDHIEEGDKGMLEFTSVYAYRLGPTNDKAFDSEQLRNINNQAPEDGFYELIDSNRNKDFSIDKMIVNEAISKKELRHFILFFRDQSFECIATGFHFSYLNSVSETMEEKYPKGYFRHYLVMFFQTFDTPAIERYEIYNDLYIQMESKKEFNGVKSEIKAIKSNNDMDLFLKFANRIGNVYFKREHLNAMIKTIENYKIEI